MWLAHIHNSFNRSHWQMRMNISQFSRLTELSTHTLRYYEKLGLLTNIARNANGRRDYSAADVDWARFINRLKATGMPLVQILNYSRLRAEGESTLEPRRQILQNHRNALQARIEAELEHLKVLDSKIAYYQSLKP